MIKDEEPSKTRSLSTTHHPYKLAKIEANHLLDIGTCSWDFGYSLKMVSVMLVHSAYWSVSVPNA